MMIFCIKPPSGGMAESGGNTKNLNFYRFCYIEFANKEISVNFAEIYQRAAKNSCKLPKKRQVEQAENDK